MKKRVAHNKLPLNEPYIIEQYESGRSTNDIAAELGVSGSAISRRLTKLGIKKRKLEYDIQKPELQRLYIDEKLSVRDIAKQYGCGKTLINNLLIKFEIPLRSNAGAPSFTKEERRAKWGLRGSDSPAWKGGVTGVNEYLRRASYDWRASKMAEANYLCWITGKEAPRLNVHHAYPWYKIRDEAMHSVGIYGYTNVGDCPPELIEECYEVLVDKHSRLPGYVIDERLHVLFHQIYGNDVTDADIHEFKERYLRGEFNVKPTQYKTA